MGKIEWENAKTRLDALLVIDEYRTDPNKEWLRLVVKIEENYGDRYLIDNGSGDSLDVIFANVLFSTSILSNTCLVAFINEQYPYSLFSIKSTRSKPSYFATFTDIPLVSANKYAT